MSAAAERAVPSVPMPAPVMAGPVVLLGSAARLVEVSAVETLLASVIQEIAPVFVVHLHETLLVANRRYMELFGLRHDDMAAIDAHVDEVRDQALALRDDLNGPDPVLAHRSFRVAGQDREVHYRIAFFPIYAPGHTQGGHSHGGHTQGGHTQGGHTQGERLTAIGGTYTEITGQVLAVERLQRVERSYQDILRSSSDWAWETDAAGAIAFVSERITEILGRPPALLEGRRFAGIVSPADAESLERRLASSQPFRNELVRFVDRSGRMRHQHISGVPVFDLPSGRFTGFRGTGTDVTREVEAEQRSSRARLELEEALADLSHKNRTLDTALDRAQAAARAKDTFLANMSHELRTPLNAIIGFADVIASQTFAADSARTVEYSRYILNAGHHLLRLINDVLDLSQVEHDALTIAAGPVALADLLAEAHAFVAERATSKQIAIAVDAPPPTLIVCVDRTRALQILLNLLTNAVKFTPGGGSVGVSWRRDQAQACVTVWDAGPGINEDMQRAIFEPFVQIHAQAHTRPHEGAGLGLPIARRLAKLMGGDLMLESTIGVGSRFTVSMPLA